MQSFWAYEIWQEYSFIDKNIAVKDWLGHKFPYYFFPMKKYVYLNMQWSKQ